MIGDEYKATDKFVVKKVSGGWPVGKPPFRSLANLPFGAGDNPKTVWQTLVP